MFSQTDIRTFYELQPLVQLSQWWQPLAWLLAVGVVLAFVVWMYRRDARNLPRPIMILFCSLRLLVIGCVVLYVLNPGKRSETRIVKSSKLAVLVDTSLSMGLADEVPGTGGVRSQGPRRIDQVVKWLNGNDELDRLRLEHDIEVYQFGDQGQPQLLVELPRTRQLQQNSATSISVNESNLEKLNREVSQSSWIGQFAFAIAMFAVVGLLVAGYFYYRKEGVSKGSVMLAVSVLGLMISLSGLGLCDLAAPQADLMTSMGWKELPETANTIDVAETATEAETNAVEDVDWQSLLSLKGTSTEIGSCIQFIVNKERGGPIAGVILVTDGRNNSGVPPAKAIAAASNAGIPLYPIGIGSTESPKNVVVADIQAPPKVFPSDKFQIKGFVKAYGLAGRNVRVELLSVDEDETEAETIEGDTTVRLLEDGQASLVEFDVVRQEQGKRRYIIRTAEIEGDLDRRDNERSAMVEIVERQTKVLLVAGGPSRDFRFLRNQLYRDKDVLLHVWLQSAKEGADQESDVLLQEFPQTREGLYFYDCIIGFDPDWRDLSKSQCELLERWVAEQAGGLVVIAGPVNTPEWTRRPRGDEAIDFVRRLYPVSFYSQGTAQLKLGRFGGDQAFPLDFSREGRASEFLWLGDSSSDSQDNWSRFDGVFGYYAVNEPKPGADILANFADPSTAVDEQLPIYMATHFYGAGRVFFQASSEMWRMRRIDVDYFVQYYTKLIRWVSQGRLLRDSTRGVLLTDRDRCWMGDEVVVQAILRDPQDQPLLLPSVPATIRRPDGTSDQLELKSNKNAVRPGSYQGQFTAGSEGDYRISLPIPASPDFEVLMTSVQANIPDLEKERPQRNDPLLAEMADKTVGHYYIGTESFQSSENNPLSPVKLIQPQDQETFLAGTLDRFFRRKLMIWLLTLLTVALAFEWTLRRLHKLA